MATQLTPTDIEYALGPAGEPGRNWNFYPGCLHKPNGVCPIPKCWAETVAKRRLEDFHKPHLVMERLTGPLTRQKPSCILVNFAGDLFGDWVDPDIKIDFHSKKYKPTTLWQWLWDVTTLCEQHRFVFLTKAPQNYNKWPYLPENCWLGATACNQEMLIDALDSLWKTHAVHKWLSLEPLLEPLNGGECEGKRLDGLKQAGIEFVVIGAQRDPTVYPRAGWVAEIVQACQKQGIKVWMKHNMYEMFLCAGDQFPWIQEVPWW